MSENSEQKASIALPIFSYSDSDLSTIDADLWCLRINPYIELTQEKNINA